MAAGLVDVARVIETSFAVHVGKSLLVALRIPSLSVFFQPIADLSGAAGCGGTAPNTGRSNQVQ